MDKCVLCEESQGQMSLVGEKGFSTLLRISNERDLKDLQEKLICMKDSESKVLVHHDCRRKFVDCRRKKEQPEPERKKLRSSTEASFDWKSFCFLCGIKADIYHNKKRDHIHQVCTLPLHNTLVQSAKERNDEWGNIVLHRLESCIDLVAAEAIYHSDCASKFRLQKASEVATRGRPSNSNMFESFEQVCDWLECSGDSEIYSIGELHNKMSDGNKNVYSMKWFREKLKEKYKDHIYFVQSVGCKGELVCFRRMTDYILRKLKEEGAESKEKVIKAAAKIIKEEIRGMSLNKDQYPSIDDICKTEGESFVPDTLQLLMKHLVPSDLKRESLGQCIVQAARPRSSIMPIPFGVGVEVDKTMGSKWLITHLNRLGLSISYDEVTKFKQSAIVNMDIVENVTEYHNDTFAQWVADNVDHDIATLTGKGTFHGMGIICVDSKPTSRFQNIPRLKKSLPSSFVTSRGIEIVPFYKVAKLGLSKVMLDPVIQMKKSASQSAMEVYDLLWHSSWMFSPPETPRPNWSGFMQCTTKASNSALSSSTITFLPIIDLNPSDETCIYSTLLFVIAQAKKLHVRTPCITFDQPLWIKALGIIYSENLPIVCRLGGFHTLMSFLGSIGKVMSGSGIEDLFSEVYAENSVKHIMSGKAIARALRAHILLESALTSLLLEIIKENNDVEFGDLEKFYKVSLDGNLTEELFEDLNTEDSFEKISDSINQLKAKLRAGSRTSQLWLMYMDYVHLVKMFVYAERTSNWELHLSALSKMLNLFAATGHNNYARCARLYLQEMKRLPQTAPWLHDQFLNEKSTVRRTSKNWTGIWTDLAIEQTLMRSLKSKGGLTVGRGMTESTRHQWVLSLSHSASIHDAMTQLTGATHKSSEQHHELGASRTRQDYNDCHKFLDWLSVRNPFVIPGDDLHALSSGLISIVGKDEINCEKSESVGKVIQNGLDNTPFIEATFKRKHQVKCLESLSQRISSKNEERIADPKTMFNRMITVAEREDDIESFFEFELTPEPMALFKDGMLRKPDKPSLRKVIMPEENSIHKEDIVKICETVLDGGALLHRVRWSKGKKFFEISDAYLRYIRKNYDSKVTVVFDGYEDESIKSHEHQRRNLVPQSCNVEIHPNNQVPFTQDRFLSNTANKSSFIDFLSGNLLESGIHVINCPGDADSTIVQVALDVANQKTDSVLLVADDTDIAVMLVHHWKKEFADVFFLQERWNRAWSVKESCIRNQAIKDQLLFLHAFTGCDTTSSIHGKGKASLAITCEKSEAMREFSDIISSPWSNQSEVGEASIKVVKMLYGGKEKDTLKRLR